METERDQKGGREWEGVRRVEGTSTYSNYNFMSKLNILVFLILQTSTRLVTTLSHPSRVAVVSWPQKGNPDNDIH